MNDPKYRPEIDGLRAISVISVIIFHINKAWLSGGFVGVDIFFVISGYLITSNILPKLENKTFSFLDFYTRRVKRLLPSLFVLLFATVFASWALFIAEDVSSLNHSIEKIILFWANHHFAAGLDYFAPLTSETPLLHTWSLAIEEQFYFLWPLIVFGLFLVGVRRKNIFKLSLVGIFVSLLLAMYLNLKGYHSWAYYSFPTRYGELLLGSLLSYSLAPGTRFDQGQKSMISALGLVMIFASFFVIGAGVSFPGFSALLPCLGAVFVLYAGLNKVTAWLSFKPMVFLGKISYQLYLWHWPVLAFIRYCKGQYLLSSSEILLAVVLTFTISVLVWKFIETPIRFSKFSFKFTFISMYLAPATLLFVLIKVSPLVVFESQVYRDQKLSSYGEDVCHGSFDKTCFRGADNTAPSLLVIGDSHAAHLNSFFATLGKEQGWSSLVITGSSCSPVFDFNEFIIADKKTRESCTQLKELVKLNIPKFSKIAIASRWDFQLGFATNEIYDAGYLQKLKNTLKFLESQKIQVFLISQVPLRGVSPQRAELLKSRYGMIVANSQDDVVNSANKIIKNLASEFSNVTWVDITTPIRQLPEGLYYESLPIYKDKTHLNIYGAEILARLMKDTKF